MNYKLISTIQKGMSKDNKSIVEINNEKLLLRILPISKEKLQHYKMLYLIRTAKINMSKLRYLYYYDTNIYAFFEYIDGYDLEEYIDELDKKALYDYGVQAGCILNQIHNNNILKENMEKVNLSNKICIDKIIENYRKFNFKTETSNTIFDFIIKNIDNKNINLNDYCYLNADFHYGNFIVKNDKLTLIDLEKYEIGNRYRDFTFIYTYNENRTFAYGKINGYFGNDIPLNFWPQFKFFSALYILQYYMWEFKHTGKYDNATKTMNLFLMDYEDNNLIPKWYSMEKEKCKIMDT